MKRLLLLLFISVIAAGCAGGNINVKPDEGNDNIAGSGLAYVLVGNSAGSAYTGWLHNSRAYNGSYEKYEILHVSTTLFGGENYQFVQLQPGTYTLVSLQQTAGYQETFNLTPEAQRKNEALKHEGGLLASFNVEKGKINYLGNLYVNVHPVFKNISISVKDDRNAALEFLSKNYPKIDPEKLFTVKLIRAR